MATNNKTIIIIGMHRSGTSLTASLLQKSGLNIGKKLLVPNQGNVSGYFENTDFLDFHRRSLTKLGYNHCGWDLVDIQEMDASVTREAYTIIKKNQSSVWGWKDPRTTLFINFWAKLLPDAYFLFVYRSPVEVADSLFRRGDNIMREDPERAIDTWLHYNKLALKYYNLNKSHSLFVNIKTVVHNYPAFIEAINQKFGINLKSETGTLFNKSLFKEHSEDDKLAADLYRFKPEVKQLYQSLINNS